jgi:hypothetical protein
MKRFILLGALALCFTTTTLADSKENTPTLPLVQRFDYVADFAAFKEAVAKKDKETIDWYNKAEGTDADMIIMFFEDPDFLKQLKSAKYEDLTASDFNGTPVVTFSATVSGKDEEGNEYESGIYLYFEETGSGLRLVNVLAAG